MNKFLTDGGRVLTRTEVLLCEFMGEGREREACALAPHVYIPDVSDPTPFIEAAVINTLVAALEEVHGQHAVLECVGQRRDTLRDHHVVRQQQLA